MEMLLMFKEKEKRNSTYTSPLIALNNYAFKKNEVRHHVNRDYIWILELQDFFVFFFLSIPCFS